MQYNNLFGSDLYDSHIDKYTQVEGLLSCLNTIEYVTSHNN